MDERGVRLQAWRREDHRGNYLVSTNIHLLDHDFIQRAFATEEMHWAKPLPAEQLQVLLSQSQTLGLYRVSPSAAAAMKSSDSPSSPRTPSPTVRDVESGEELEQIGMARLVTDHVTTAYLTDVFVDAKYRTNGLGKWLIACCKDVLTAMPALRRAVLVANGDVGKQFYSRELGFWDANDDREHYSIMTRRAY